MTLPNINITPIPDTDPDAVPSLWNTRYAEMNENFAYLEAGILDQAGNAHSADEAIKLAWWMQDAKVKIEQWTSEWSLHDPLSIAVTEGVAGDDSVDVADTAGLVVGREYVIFDATHYEVVVVSEILTGTRFTTAANLIYSYTTGTTIAGCQWDVSPNLAHAVNGEICYFLPLNVGDDSGDKTVIVRREDNGCGLKVYFKDADQVAWLECTAGSSTEVETGIVDVPYAVPGKGLIALKFVCETGGSDDNMDVYLVGVLNLSISHNVVYEDTTFYLSPTGNDTTGNGSSSSPWLTVNKVFEALANKRINEGVTVTIELDDGVYSNTETLLANHPDGNKITIKGKNVYQKSMSAIVNTTGTEATPEADVAVGNTVQAVIQLDNVTNVSVGDVALIRNLFENADVGALYTPDNIEHFYRAPVARPDLSSRGTPLHLNGVFDVTAVDAGNSQITVQAKFRTNTADINNLNVITGNYTGDVTIVKAVLEFTGCTGVRVDGGNVLGANADVGALLPGIDNLVIKNLSSYALGSNLDAWITSTGIGAFYGGRITLGENVGVSQFWVGVGAIGGSSVFADKIVTTGCHHGAQASDASFISAAGSYHSGNGNGWTSTFDSSIFGVASVVTCSGKGFCAFESVAWAGGCIAENVAYGYSAIYNAALHAMDSKAYNCVYGVYSKNSFVHAASFSGIGCTKGVYCESGKVRALPGLVLTNCTTGAYAMNFGEINVGTPTLSGNSADYSPALNTEGNTHAFIIG